MAAVKKISTVPNPDIEKVTGAISVEAPPRKSATDYEWLPWPIRDWQSIIQPVTRTNLAPESETRPVKLRSTKLGYVWLYRHSLYHVQGCYSDEECRLLIMEDFDKERRKWESLKRKFDSAEAREEASRPRIPESVRVEVWRRDGGKCARCGSREKLEYDHIVPLSKGGSNTARNVELLCEKCNRSKGGNIA
jgi:hypothetical protein